MTDDNRPIKVGDYVRLDVLGAQFVGAWQEGTVEKFDDLGYAAVRLQNAGPDMVSDIGRVRRLWLKSLRRIPRPDDAQATQATVSDDPDCVHGDAAWLCERCHPIPTEPPAPVLVEGLTRAQCLERYRDNMQRADDSLPWPLTPAQQVAAREEWSAALRAGIAASAEAEQNRVRIDPQDEP